MWVPFDTFGEIKGRVRGVALPLPNGQVLVWTSQGLFALWYFNSAFVNKLADAREAEGLFNPATGALSWNGTAYPMLGECSPANDVGAHARHPSGERVAIDTDSGAVTVFDAAGEAQQLVDVVPPDGWGVAAFSADGKTLVVADPANVRVFRYRASAGGERPRWAASADPGDQVQLLKAVLAHPDEDTPRLAYADWLDEHDDPSRAEFIRVQCRYAERAAGEPVPATDPDHQRSFQLEGQLGARWLAELPVVRGVKWHGFWRGFPGVSVVSPTTLVRAAPKVWAAAPVEMVSITGLNQAGAGALAASDVFRKFRALTLEKYYIRQDGTLPLQALFHSPRASALKRLTLVRSVGEEGIGTVVSSPHLVGLEWLAIGSGGLTDGAAEALIRAPALKNLKSGSFASYQLSDAVRERLRARFPTAAV